MLKLDYALYNCGSDRGQYYIREQDNCHRNADIWLVSQRMSRSLEGRWIRVGNCKNSGRENSIKMEKVSTNENVKGTREGKSKCKIRFPRGLIIRITRLEIVFSTVSEIELCTNQFPNYYLFFFWLKRNHFSWSFKISDWMELDYFSFFINYF